MNRVPAPGRHPSLWRNRDFNVFWLGQALSVLGGSISLLALPVLILDATGSVVQMGLLTVVAGVGTIATGLFAGYVVDRTDRRRLMIACDLLRALLMGSVPFVWLVAGPRIWLLYVVTALVTVLKTLFDVAYVTAVPNLVPVEHLTAANGRLTAAFAFGTLCGPATAGFIAAAVGADWALGVDGATFLVSAVSLRWVAFGREQAGAARPSGPEPEKLREMFTEGFRFLWAHPVLRALTVLLTLLTFVTLGATDLLIYRVGEELGRSEATVGFVIALSGLGVVGGGLTPPPPPHPNGVRVCWGGEAPQEVGA
ncbi:MFS transporter, partial [Streptomyces vinaceus]|uniref:MFS transporter n=1 Tax=Streptomyces vinaceus TaxID=1960 RepID=UPI0036759592